ncbi:hypothetical protein M4D55_12385 [Metabacillus idriensis]|uniref:Uncharacterized protein n=1 Tax=Metabacillus idriensis TaxID=324768 RepID=A0A6I2MFX6_9BACI|nr:hypothetical protein [Metabacillus idriensis]MCM3596576.1 hypothetical protein [Metabacillus idriensis]MRX55341.1 hypothetical protein [Metabacillus idriensis]OHR68149.1 hypothetical protein HMPREF3291_09805 [Bacillus sp. HMSC76G11]
MKVFFHKVVSALSQSIPFPITETIEVNHFTQELTDFVIEQFHRMAVYLQAALFIATIFFGFYGLFVGGKLFQNLPEELKVNQIKRWKNSKISYFRDFIRFYESLIFLRLFSKLEEEMRGNHHD